jgi:hypothetical protein
VCLLSFSRYKCRLSNTLDSAIVSAVCPWCPPLYVPHLCLFSVTLLSCLLTLLLFFHSVFFLYTKSILRINLKKTLLLPFDPDTVIFEFLHLILRKNGDLRFILLFIDLTIVQSTNVMILCSSAKHFTHKWHRSNYNSRK